MNSSLIVRVKNEKENLEKLFKILQQQVNQDFEIIIVDNNSSDGSRNLIKDFFPKNRYKIIDISKFSYPKSCNLGARAAKGKYLVYLSAHSYPITNTWLSDGLKNMKDLEVAGVFAYPRQEIDDMSLAELLFYTLPNKIRISLKRVGWGELGNTNSIIRKDLWEKHSFDEKLVNGSEDYEWSRFWSLKGMKIVNDPKFSVYHTHHLGFIELIKRQMKWKRIKAQIESDLKAKNH